MFDLRLIALYNRIFYFHVPCYLHEMVCSWLIGIDLRAKRRRRRETEWRAHQPREVLYCFRVYTSKTNDFRDFVLVPSIYVQNIFFVCDQNVFKLYCRVGIHLSDCSPAMSREWTRVHPILIYVYNRMIVLQYDFEIISFVVVQLKIQINNMSF